MCLLRQSWALLEEDIGNLQRAEELRSFRQQRRTEVVLPRTFADPDVVLAPVFSQIAAWFKHSEVLLCVRVRLQGVIASRSCRCRMLFLAACMLTCAYAAKVGSSRRRGSPASKSGYLALDDDARPATVLTGTRAPAQQWSDGSQSQAFSTMFGGTEYQKMISLNELDELQL